MKYLIITFIFFVTACNTLPQLYQSAEDIATDEAIQVSVSREAISKQTDVSVSIEVKNNAPVAK